MLYLLIYKKENKMFNVYEFEKRVRQEADILNQTLKDERIHEYQRSK